MRLRKIEKAVYLPCARCGATLEAAAGVGRGGARSPPARTPGGPVCQRCRPLRPRGHSSPHILLHSATVTSKTIKLIQHFKICFTTVQKQCLMYGDVVNGQLNITFATYF